jgi:hypothetical protein
MNKFLSTTIELWPVERLIPYDRNARTHSDQQIEQMARRIREFGFTNPILVDTRAGILAGQARLLVNKLEQRWSAEVQGMARAGRWRPPLGSHPDRRSGPAGPPTGRALDPAEIGVPATESNAQATCDKSESK